MQEAQGCLACPQITDLAQCPEPQQIPLQTSQSAQVQTSGFSKVYFQVTANKHDNSRRAAMSVVLLMYSPYYVTHFVSCRNGGSLMIWFFFKSEGIIKLGKQKRKIYTYYISTLIYLYRNICTHTFIYTYSTHTHTHIYIYWGFPTRMVYLNYTSL